MWAWTLLRKILNVQFSWYPDKGFYMKRPYQIVVFKGPLLEEPLVFETFDLDKAIKHLEYVKKTYKQYGHWMSVDSGIYRDADRWDLMS